MKWQYKILSLVLASMLVFGLAACGGSGGNVTDTPVVSGTGTQEPTSSNNTPASVEEIADEEPVGRYGAKDMNGREFKWLSWWDLNETPHDMSEPDPDEADNYYIDMMIYDNAMSVYRDYNATITNVTVGFDEVMEVLTSSVMAGDPAGDLVLLDHAWILNAIIGNLIIPFDDFLPADHDIFTTQDHMSPTSNLLDKSWTARRREVPVDGSFLGVNMDIIRVLGAENPAELYDRGEWTIDKFLEIARMATRDTTGDGNIDQYGIGGQPNDLLLGLIAANDGMTVTADLGYGFNHPHTIRAIESAFQIFNIDKSWNFDPLSGASFTDWHRNTYAFREGSTCFFVAWIWSLPEFEDRTFDYTAVPFPKGPDNQHDYSYFTSFMSGVAIPRGVQNPEDVITVWSELDKWYGNDFVLKDENDMEYPYSRFNRIDDADRIVKAMEAGRKIDIGTGITVEGQGYAWMTNSMCQSFYEDTGTPAQVVEENRQVREDMLDRIFGALND